MLVGAADVAEFRKRTGLPLMTAKQVLGEAGGDPEKALELAKSRGLAPDDRPLHQRPGTVGMYRHHNGQFAAVVVLRCLSDTLAKTEEFRQLADDLALHVAVMRPRFVSEERIHKDQLAIFEADLDQALEPLLVGKPEGVREKIRAGKRAARLSEICLVGQKFAKDETRKVGDLLADLSARSREPVEVESFSFVGA